MTDVQVFDMPTTLVPSQANGEIRTIGHGGTLEWIPANRLLIDVAYERHINYEHVSRLVDNWEPNAFAVLLVSLRDNGSYVLMDGQHRREGVMMMGLGDAYVPCFVMRGLTRQQEAAVWWRLNKMRLQPGTTDVFRARLVDGEPSAVAIQAICQRYGIQIRYYPGPLAPNEVFAISGLDRLYNSGLIEWVLSTIRLGWPDQPAALRLDRMDGVARLYHVFNAQFVDLELGQERRNRLVHVMTEYPPSVVAEKATEYRLTLHSRPSSAFARALHFLFNARLKNASLRLPNWPGSSQMVASE